MAQTYFLMYVQPRLQFEKMMRRSIVSINRKPIEQLNLIDSAANQTLITFD